MTVTDPRLEALGHFAWQQLRDIAPNLEPLDHDSMSFACNQAQLAGAMRRIETRARALGLIGQHVHQWIVASTPGRPATCTCGALFRIGSEPERR